MEVSGKTVKTHRGAPENGRPQIVPKKEESIDPTFILCDLSVLLRLGGVRCNSCRFWLAAVGNSEIIGLYLAVY